METTMTTTMPATHQQRWRSRLRETHDRIDVYLSKPLAQALRKSLSGDDTVSTVVESALRHALSARSSVMAMVPQDAPEQDALALSPETVAFARTRAAIHGVSIDDFMLAAMRGVKSQTVIMIRGLATVGRCEALAELAENGKI